MRCELSSTLLCIYACLYLRMAGVCSRSVTGCTGFCISTTKSWLLYCPAQQNTMVGIQGTISGKIAKDVLPRLLEGEGNAGVRAFVEKEGLVQISGAIDSMSNQHDAYWLASLPPTPP